MEPPLLVHPTVMVPSYRWWLGSRRIRGNLKRKGYEWKGYMRRVGEWRRPRNLRMRRKDARGDDYKGK